MKKIATGIAAATIGTILLPTLAFAHVVVTPNEANVGARTVFTVSVPNEKEVAVKSIKLAIPSGLQDVQPNVLAGWKITTSTDKAGDVTAITWTGTIPVDQRADLVFKAQAPASTTELDWKAYQTYADGTVVNWDQKPTADEKDDDSSNSGPYSVTRVVNDLDTNTDTPARTDRNDTLALALSIVAVILSVGGLFLRRKR